MLEKGDGAGDGDKDLETWELPNIVAAFAAPRYKLNNLCYKTLVTGRPTNPTPARRPKPETRNLKPETGNRKTGTRFTAWTR